jgi:hypothetical protein
MLGRSALKSAALVIALSAALSVSSTPTHAAQSVFERAKRAAEEAARKAREGKPQPPPPDTATPATATPAPGSAASSGAATPSTGAAEPSKPPADNAPVVALDSSKMPDVIGVRVGMTPQAALDALRKTYPNSRYNQTLVDWWPAAPKPSFGIDVTSAEVISPDAYVSLTAPPNPQVVWKMARYTRNLHVNRATLLAALREKYGKETGAYNTSSLPETNDKLMLNMYWLFDERGGRVPMPLSALNTLMACAGPLSAQSNHQPTMPVDDTDLAQRFPSLCTTFVGIHVDLGSVEDIVDNTFTETLDVPLAFRTARAAKAWLQDIAEKKHQEELEKSKRAKPVL